MNTPIGSHNQTANFLEGHKNLPILSPDENAEIG